MRVLILATAVACALSVTATSAPAARGAQTGYLAPTSACPAVETTAAVAAQVQSVLCLVNWARGRAGQSRVRPVPLLMRAASRKAVDVIRCDNFSHTPCGRRPSAAVTASGYRYASWGENLFFGTGTLGSPRTAVEAWLNSPSHRRTMLAKGFAHAGVALARPDSLEGTSGVSLWVLQLAIPR